MNFTGGANNDEENGGGASGADNNEGKGGRATLTCHGCTAAGDQQELYTLIKL